MNNQFSIFNNLNLIKKKKVIRIDYLYLDLKTCDIIFSKMIQNKAKSRSIRGFKVKIAKIYNVGYFA